MSQKIQVNAVAFQEGDAWVIQGIEYDIVAHADTMTALEGAFTRAVLENVVITEHLGRKPLEGIGPAPQHFREMFDAAEVEVRHVRPTRRKPHMPATDVSVRLVERARVF